MHGFQNGHLVRMFYDDFFGDLEQQFKSISITPCMSFCCNLRLGLMTKARSCKVAGQERKPGSERKCEGMNPHTPKGTFTLGVGVPVDSRMFKERLQG
jgi:hypothetical protein